MWRQAVVLVGVVIAGVSLRTVPASAETISVSQQIVVRGEVAPARYIIVNPNDQSQIISIMSNSTQAVKPRAYLGSITTGSEIPLSASLLEKYQTILDAHPGLGAGELSGAALVPVLQREKQRPVRYISSSRPIVMQHPFLAFWELPSTARPLFR